jgi:uncharacterized membrane protein YhhN
MRRMSNATAFAVGGNLEGIGPQVARVLRHPSAPLPLLPIQRVSVVVFGLLGVILAGAIVMDAPDGVLRWLKTPVIVLMVVMALAARHRTPTQQIVTGALALSTLGDAFIVGFIDLPGGASRLAGIGCFALAYVVLIAAFWRGRPRPDEAPIALVLGVLGGVLCWVLWPTLPAAMQVPVAVFALVIAVMAWTTCATLGRGRFSLRISVWAATTGVLLFLSDALVALQMFHPAFTPAPLASEVTIRMTYQVGWLLMLLVVQEPKGALVATHGPGAAR